MNCRLTRWAPILLTVAFYAGPLPAADALSKDLTSTIALLGLPCGQVVSSRRLGENDYLATCKNKMRYRVFVDAKGRVVAQRQ